jgi:hypothetical protein
MKIQEAFREFLVELKSNNPVSFNETIDETTYKIFDEIFTPHFLAILQKDEKIFTSSLPIFGIDLSDVWSSRYWKYLQKCSILCFLHSDIPEKLKQIIPALSSTFSEVTGKSSDDIDEILNDDATPSKITEIVEMLKNSIMLNIALEFIEMVDFSEITEHVDPDNMTPESMKNNPALQKLQEKFKTLLQNKIRTGEISQQTLGEEINAFALKLQSLMGDMFTGGGRQSDTPTEVLLGNTPASRHARMLARMRRKLEENKNRKNSS